VSAILKTKPQTTQLPIEDIRIDGGTQPRAELDNSVVAEYADAILAGSEMPPVVVYFDGKAHWLADGFHRFHAHRKAGIEQIRADISTGTKRDAILFSLSANASHGLRRSNDDKRRAVAAMIADTEWSSWSDRQIAAHCGVSAPFVASVRRPEAAARQTANRSKSTPGCNRITPAGETESPKAPIRGPDESDSTPLPKILPRPEQKTSTAAVVEEHDDAPDLAELVDELQAENKRLSDIVSADDKAKEALKWRGAYDRSLASQSEAMDAAARSEKREKFAKAQLMRCGKAVGVDDPRKIAAAVEALAQKAKK
jgi:hypothetical protein